MSDTLLEDAPVAVDPRIQARRDDVERARRRRRRAQLLALAAVVVVVGLAWAFAHSRLLDVDQVRVDPTAHLGADQLIEAAGVHLGDHLVDVDPATVRQRLLALPWVDDATVGVDWRAGDVHLAVTERVPVAAVGDGAGGWALVDATGRSVAAVPAGDPGLVTIEGVAPAEPGADLDPGATAPLEIITALTPGLRSRVTAVVVAGDGSLQLKLRPQGVAALCRPDRLGEKLARLTTLFAQVDDRDLATVSVCVPDKPTVTRVSAP